MGRAFPEDPPGYLSPLRKPLGDGLYVGLVGSGGRVVGAHRAGAAREPSDLLTVQPRPVPPRDVDDDWVFGLLDRHAIRASFPDGTGVTDRSCDAILEMTNLGELGLADTALSDEAVARLDRAPDPMGRLLVGGPNIRAIRKLVDHAVSTAGGVPPPDRTRPCRSGGTSRFRGCPARRATSG